MKRFFAAIFGVALLLGCSVPSFGETATQQDQNAGFLDFVASTTFTVQVGSSVILLSEAPANIASWVTNNPNAAYAVLPNGTKGFVMNATGSNMLIGHPNDVSSGAYPVGYPVTAGTPFQWASRNPNQKRISFKVINNGSTTGYVTFAAWGE